MDTRLIALSNELITPQTAMDGLFSTARRSRARGAIYPALLALVETGHVRTTDRDGTRIYSLTEAGQRAAASQRSNTRWASLTARAEEGEERVSIGSLLDRFADDSRLRRRLARTEQRELIEAILARAGAEIERTLEEGENDG